MDKEIDLPSGLGKSDKVDEFVKRLKKQPSQFKPILKTMQQKKKERECNICLRSDTTIIPTMVWICSDCVRKYARKFKEIKIITKQNYLPKRRCTGCMKKKITHFQVNVWLCHKCLPKIAKREREIQNDYRDRIGKLIGRNI